MAKTNHYFDFDTAFARFSSYLGFVHNRKNISAELLVWVYIDMNHYGRVCQCMKAGSYCPYGALSWPGNTEKGKPMRFRLSARHRMMVDTLTRQQRSETMSRIRGRDTKPEWVLRCGLHRLGFRYRLDNRHLPGRPDLVFPKYRAVVFVHGCYWHRHPGCKDAGMPGTNVDFWRRKFDENVARDRRKQQQLADSGWRVMVVWECELVGQTVPTLQRVASWLTNESNASYARVNRRQLLAVAERKVRYRIARYKDQPATGNPVANEALPKCKRNDSP